MKQKLFIFLLAVLTGTGTLFAESGTCGDNLTWDLTNGVLTISGTGAMTNYDWDSPFSQLSISSVVINDGVTSIGNDAFDDCRSLTSVTIPNSVTSIGNGAFKNCRELTSITIPNNVTSIGKNAFYDCESLTSVNIGNSVTSIGDNAFYDCESLTSVTIPNSVTSIGHYAFYFCSGLVSVTLGNSVTSIGNYAFYKCSNLTSVTIPNSVTSIGNHAFEACENLSSVTIGNSVTSIGEKAFQSCRSLTSVTNYAEIPQTIGADAFYNVDLSECTLNVPEGSVESYQAADVWNGFGTIQAILCVIASGTCGDNLTWILTCDSTLTISGTGAMANYGEGNAPWYSYRASITSVIISDDVTSIGEYAFYYLSNLNSATIGNSVTSIGSDAFEQCSSLTSVEIPNSVTSIGGFAFYGCSGLTSVTNYATTPQTMGKYVFYGVNQSACTLNVPKESVESYKAANQWNYFGTIQAILSVIDSGTCGDNLTWTLTSDSTLTISGTGDMANYGWDSPFFYRNDISSVVINDGVTSIGEYAFLYCNLTSVEIPNSVISIGSSAFYYCESLTSVEIPNSVISIGNFAFSNCSSLTSIEIPNSVTSIGSGAFSGCSGLASVTLGNSVTSIGIFAFSNCSSLTSVTNYAETPQTINSNVFDEVNISACTLNVPEGSVESYQAADVWKDFGTIQAIDEEPEPAAVENVQGGKVQGTKFFRDGQLLIEKNGKIYNAQGVRVK